MKAIVITTPGGSEVLQLQEVEDPQLRDDEILIRVHATSLNRADTLQRKGSYPPPKGASLYPGLECSGTIEYVSRWKIGDQEQFHWHVKRMLLQRERHLTEATNLQQSSTFENTGKWQCPRKRKPNTGPALKQLRLERWVRRI